MTRIWDSGDQTDTYDHKVLVDTCCGRMRRRSDIQCWEWIFLVTSIITLSASTIFTIKDLAQLSCHCDDFVLALVILVTTAMCFYHSIISVFSPQPSETVAYVISTILLLAYSGVSYHYDKQDVDDLVRLVFNSIGGIVCFFLAIPCNIMDCPYRWFIFRLNAGGERQKPFHYYFTCKSLSVVDFQLQVSMLIFVGDSKFWADLQEKILFSAGVIIMIVWTLVAWRGMRTKNKRMIGAFLGCTIYLVFYDAFRLADVFFKMPTMMYIVSISVCASVGLVVTLIVLALTTQIWEHCGEGVKDDIDLRPSTANDLTLTPINDHMTSGSYS